jgi:5'-AMP-activated protein kinase, catalytic alpha subunit
MLLFRCTVHIFKGDTQIPEWLSPSVRNLLRRVFEPNPIKLITMAEISF